MAVPEVEATEEPTRAPGVQPQQQRQWRLVLLVEARVME